MARKLSPNMIAVLRSADPDGWIAKSNAPTKTAASLVERGLISLYTFRHEPDFPEYGHWIREEGRQVLRKLDAPKVEQPKSTGPKLSQAMRDGIHFIGAPDKLRRDYPRSAPSLRTVDALRKRGLAGSHFPVKLTAKGRDAYLANQPLPYKGHYQLPGEFIDAWRGTRALEDARTDTERHPRDERGAWTTGPACLADAEPPTRAVPAEQPRIVITERVPESAAAKRTAEQIFREIAKNSDARYTIKPSAEHPKFGAPAAELTAWRQSVLGWREALAAHHATLARLWGELNDAITGTQQPAWAIWAACAAEASEKAQAAKWLDSADDWRQAMAKREERMANANV